MLFRNLIPGRHPEPDVVKSPPPHVRGIHILTCVIKESSSQSPPLELTALPSANASAPLSKAAFLSCITAVRTNIATISTTLPKIRTLQQASLSDPSSTPSAALTHHITTVDNTIATTRDILARIRTDTNATPRSALRTLKGTQIVSVTRAFADELRAYYDAERLHRDACREQVARLFRIVHPDASDAEVQTAAETSSASMESGVDGVFQTALETGTRTGVASSTLATVRTRRAALAQVETSMTELSALFTQLATLVEQQDAPLETVDVAAEDAALEVGKASEEVRKATEHARARRRKKWYVFWAVVFLVLASVAIGVGVGLRPRPPPASP
ncbi:MAG: hypothetical protein M1833_003858 [Piccolia ochrophora]|nr:MAG: hypothetical protein M1833_003858 [Piccolia ochrophora]